MIRKLEKEEFYSWIKSVKTEDNVSKEDKHFLNDMRIAPFYKCTTLAFIVDENIVATLSYTVTKGYLNIYYHYTLVDYRGQGFSGKLLAEAMKTEEGKFDRMYARASTEEAFLFYRKKNFKFYGRDDDGAYLVEKHLSNSARPLKSDKYNINKERGFIPKLFES